MFEHSRFFLRKTPLFLLPELFHVLRGSSVKILNAPRELNSFSPTPFYSPLLRRDTNQWRDFPFLSSLPLGIPPKGVEGPFLEDSDLSLE